MKRFYINLQVIVKSHNFAFLLLLELVTINLKAAEPALKEIRYTTSSEDFLNPERGWYHYRELALTGTFDLNVRNSQSTLVFLKIRADAYRTTPLSTQLLSRLEQAFMEARTQGIKVIPRVAYNDGPEAGCTATYGCDAPKSIILQHISQLAPLWKKYKDAIYLLDPGFIGGWGEWHSSSNGLDNKTDRTDILFAILDSLPADRMTYIRYPGFKREIFGGTQTSETEILGADRAFNRSKIARVGHLNDCFLSSANDVGTYQVSGWNRTRELSYIQTEGAYTPFGGESCALHAMSLCANTLKEMAQVHIDHLNNDYFEDVITRWQADGCYDSISTRLGYRFALTYSRLPDSIQPGGTLPVQFAIQNRGFGELFNPRNVEIVLYRDAQIHSVVLPIDPRKWSGGKMDTMSYMVGLPFNLTEGTYKIGVRLPDFDSILSKDMRYNIRFANQNVWNTTTGVNELKTNLIVSKQASGMVDSAQTKLVIKNGVVPVFDKMKSAIPQYQIKWIGSDLIQLTLSSHVTEAMHIQLRSPNGKLVKGIIFGKELISKPNNTYLLPVHDLTKGLYIVDVESHSGSLSLPVIIP